MSVIEALGSSNGLGQRGLKKIQNETVDRNIRIICNFDDVPITNQ